MTFDVEAMVQKQMQRIKDADASEYTPQELAERHTQSKGHLDTTVKTLMQWVTEAQKVLPSDKLDGVARARLGALLIDACKYLDDRVATAKREMNRANRSN
jgi:hypothetical protein